MTKTLFKMFLDDERFPPEDHNDFYIARSSNDAIEMFKICGCPDFISFDHDLGGEDTAMAVIHWMIDMDIESEFNFIPNDFSFYVHSQNPIGVKNIQGLMNGYLEFRKT